VFNLKGGELIVIALLALVVLGPEKLPEAARWFGRVYAQIRRMGDGFTKEFQSAVREPLDDFRSAVSDPLKDLKSSLDETISSSSPESQRNDDGQPETSARDNGERPSDSPPTADAEDDGPSAS
jgi:sec-independent protein translocase protein TatB